MSLALSAAAIFAAVICLIHVIAGGREVHVPIQAHGLPPGLRAISAVLWHAVTVILIVMAGATAWLAMRPEPGLAVALIAICLGWAGLFVWYGLRQLGTVRDMPQWGLFLALAGLIGWGMWG
ncbi:hypothetical protein [Roseobacter sp. HKCCA0434]|uniref:hypothetical protein n=1 Tax=Roseobacter sp. HKCCA0434 TaxID=3079297 RepID=UPI00290585B2|nr:hypothetical protein [Roseobacter sp. HKCCA0434]